MMKFKPVVGEVQCTDDFWYDLFDGGYIQPETLLMDVSDIERVLSAVTLLQQFRREAFKSRAIEEM